MNRILNFGLGFGIWIWDLGLGLVLDNLEKIVLFLKYIVRLRIKRLILIIYFNYPKLMNKNV